MARSGAQPAADRPFCVQAGWQVRRLLPTSRGSHSGHRAGHPEQEPHAGHPVQKSGTGARGQGPLHNQCPPPAETRARALPSGTPDSPRSQAAPVRPGGHRHWPVTGSQGAPALQSQRWWQPSPKEPGSHPGGGQWTQRPFLSPPPHGKARGAHGTRTLTPLAELAGGAGRADTLAADRVTRGPMLTRTRGPAAGPVEAGGTG